MLLWYGCAPSPRGQTPSQIIAFGEVPAVSFLGRRRRVAVSGPCLHDRPRQSSPRPVRADPGGPPPAARRGLERLCGVLEEELARREEERLTRVLDRIREKIVSELRPLDLAYQVLDGLHQLVEYDHSSAFLAYDGESGALRVEAEKIVWTKAKSPFVGREIPVSPERIARLCRAIEIRTMSGASGTASPSPSPSPSAPVAPVAPATPAIPAAPAAPADDSEEFGELLDYQLEAGMPPVTSLLSAPLFFGDEFLGILKMAA